MKESPSFFEEPSLEILTRYYDKIIYQLVQSFATLPLNPSERDLYDRQKELDVLVDAFTLLYYKYIFEKKVDSDTPNEKILQVKKLYDVLFEELEFFKNPSNQNSLE
jgi:hypothetical protein